MYIHILAILTQICYNIYQFLTWHMRTGIRWAKANWKSRERFLEAYQPSTEEQRETEAYFKNRAGVFDWELKRAMLTPRPPANEDDPIWGELNKKSNVDRFGKR